MRKLFDSSMHPENVDEELQNEEEKVKNDAALE